MSVRLRLGYIRLIDSAVLLVADALGFARDEGVDLDLKRETSWANIRDRLAFEHFDGAHCLMPLAIAMGLGRRQPLTDLVILAALGLNGNAVTVSNSIFSEIADICRATISHDARTMGQALAEVIARRRARGGNPLVCAVVHKLSSHNYMLRHWLFAHGIDPDRDIEITMLPPPYMADAMVRGHIDLFCVGAPWSHVAVDRGAGAILLLGCDLWPRGPEKVLALRRPVALKHEQAVAGLIRALKRAAAWCDAPENAEALVSLLAVPERLDCPPVVIREVISRRLRFQQTGQPMFNPDVLMFDQDAALAPMPTRARFIAAHMMAAGHLPLNQPLEAIDRLFDLEGYCAAQGLADLPVQPVICFDGEAFSADAVGDYVAHLQHLSR
jgi:two-component system, oxyanion-binding sensor